jgi:hypothetical protein
MFCDSLPAAMWLTMSCVAGEMCYALLTIDGSTADMGETTVRANLQELVRILSMTPGLARIGERVGLISAYFLGRPYLANPLVGSFAEREQLVTRLDGFDCVTFVETVLALARCRRPEDYERELSALRYEGGKVDGLARNHYTSDWIARNVAAGCLESLLAGQTVAEHRLLCTLDGYPPREQTLCYLPRARADLLESAAQTGDVVCFVSTRPELDTFHLGLLATGDPIRLRHASRSAGMVVDETLGAFLDRNETPGLLLARPVDKYGGTVS